MKQAILRKYARLIARVGVNIQKGQEVLINCDLDQPKFVELLVDECYKAGAKKVTVEFAYQPLAKLHVRHRSVTVMSKVEEWEKARLQHYVDTLPCRIYLASEDPDGLKGVNQEKMAKASKKRFPIIKPYRDAMDNKYQWCIAAVPGAAWAKKLFPELPKGWAIEKGDNGTDLTVGMIPEAEFKGGGDRTLSGVFFNPNIPTEECFISPMRGKAEGVVYATKPLSYQGQLIENFSVRFENGKAVEVHAERNEELLKKMVTMDEGAGYLGECALVPVNSPISESGLLFYETLFDENAACHLALGRGFADTIKDFENKSLEECRKLGINDSMIHVDFMIGYEGLDIDAVTRDGRTVPIFRKGKWAF